MLEDEVLLEDDVLPEAGLPVPPQAVSRNPANKLDARYRKTRLQVMNVILNALCI